MGGRRLAEEAFPQCALSLTSLTGYTLNATLLNLTYMPCYILLLNLTATFLYFFIFNLLLH